MRLSIYYIIWLQIPISCKKLKLRHCIMTHSCYFHIDRPLTEKVHFIFVHRLKTIIMFKKSIFPQTIEIHRYEFSRQYNNPQRNCFSYTTSLISPLLANKIIIQTIFFCRFFQSPQYLFFPNLSIILSVSFL